MPAPIGNAMFAPKLGFTATCLEFEYPKQGIAVVQRSQEAFDGEALPHTAACRCVQPAQHGWLTSITRSFFGETVTGGPQSSSVAQCPKSHVPAIWQHVDLPKLGMLAPPQRSWRRWPHSLLVIVSKSGLRCVSTYTSAAAGEVAHTRTGFSPAHKLPESAVTATDRE